MGKAHEAAGSTYGCALHIASGSDPVKQTQVCFTSRVSPLHPPKALKASAFKRSSSKIDLGRLYPSFEQDSRFHMRSIGKLIKKCGGFNGVGRLQIAKIPDEGLRIAGDIDDSFET